MISIVVGFARRGRLRSLGRIPLRHTFLFVLPFLLFAAIVTIAHGNPDLKPFVKAGNVIQYVLLLTAIGLNLHVREMLVAGAGTFLNFIALAANGGMMPVSTVALKVAGLPNVMNGNAVRHVVLTPATHLKLLSDVVPVPLGSPYFSEVISVGDLFVAAAIFVLIQHYMCGKVPAKEPAAGE